MKELDLQFALAITQPPDRWGLPALRDQIEALAASATNTLQRASAEVVLDRLAEFEELRKRYRGLLEDEHGPSGEAEPAEGQTPSLPETEGGGSEESVPAIDPRFDGRGWLLPVHSSQRDSPPYALLDSDGKILQFVSPAPGLNLDRYLRKEVGIYGQRDFLPEYEKSHLTADRVVRLQRHRR
jgi:hypothetical protein